MSPAVFGVPTKSGATPITALDFAGNTSYPSATPNTPIFGWNPTHLSGSSAPFAVYPATYIWRCYPRNQSSFWSMLFHAQWQTVFTGANKYYGCHPYPDPPDVAPDKWEISILGGDTVGALVTFNQWYVQVARCSFSSPNVSVTYYWNWPNTSTDIVVVGDVETRADQTDPTLFLGDAIWNRGFEATNARMRGFQYYDALLTEAQVAQEVASPGSFRTPWYLNLNPTPSDITDKSGNGHHPAWIDSNRPGLWTGP